MKKKDLKAGYLVKFTDGTLNMVTTGNYGLCISGKEHWFPVEYIKDSMTYNGNIIDEIYGFASNMNAWKCEISDRMLLWKREEKLYEKKEQIKELTLSQVCDILGYEIKIKQ